MAVSASKTWVAGEVLTASDLNAEFLNVYGNGETLGWPATVAKDMNGLALILDADGDTTVTADTDDRIDFALSGVDLFKLDGTVATPVNGITLTAGASGSPGVVSLDAVGSDSNITLNLVPKGSGEFQISGEALSTMSDLILTMQEFA